MEREKSENLSTCVCELIVHVRLYLMFLFSFLISLSVSSLHPDLLIILSDTQTFPLHKKTCKNCCSLPKLIGFMYCVTKACAHTHKVCPKSNICFWETHTAVLTSKLFFCLCFLFHLFLFLLFCHLLCSLADQHKE